MDKILIPKGIEALEAEYKEQVIPDYRYNPFIEALTKLLTPNEVVDKLAYYPEYHSSERQLDSYYRIHMINRLFQIFQPLPMNIELESKVSLSIRQGYINRNPFGAGLTKGFQKDYYKMHNLNLNIDSNLNSTSCGFTLIGISGVGKTSTLHRILNMYPQVILHTEYNGMPLSAYQVVWLKLECPHDGSIKGLILEFFSQIDSLLGTNYHEKMIRARATTDTMMTIMNQVVRNSSLGLLVIDEIQHLSMAKSGGSEKMLNFFVNLVNNVGVPVILVGTPKAIRILQGDFRQARRGAGPGGDMLCDRIEKGEIWDLLVNAVWHYQWTKQESPLTPEISSVLYEETQGIPDLLKKVYSIAQVNAITSGKEEITANNIKKAAKENLKLVQPMIAALKTGSLREIAKYEDICMIDSDFDDFINKKREIISLNLMRNDTQSKEEGKRDEDSNKRKNKIYEDSKRIKSTTHKEDEINSLDIRYIVEVGRKKNMSAYEAVKEQGYIIDFKKDVFS